MPHPEVVEQSNRSAYSALDKVSSIKTTLIECLESDQLCGDVVGFVTDLNRNGHTDPAIDPLLDVASGIHYRHGGGKLDSSRDGYKRMVDVLTMIEAMLRAAIAEVT